MAAGLAKTAAARTLQEVADRAVQVHGAAGLGPDTPLPALLRTGRTARALDGPDELHVTSVARRVLRAYAPDVTEPARNRSEIRWSIRRGPGTIPGNRGEGKPAWTCSRVPGAAPT